MSLLSRRNVAVVGALLFVTATPFRAWSDDESSPADSLQKLQIGHARYLCGKSDHPRIDAETRQRNFAQGQHPFAAVLTCADSRVPVETLFDQGVGDLFVVRVAGNVSDRHELGSLEYAAEHLHTPLIVVMGHRGCGAVGAAMASTEPYGNLGSIVKCIKPAVERAERNNPGLRGDALLDEAVKLNVWQTVRDLLTNSPILSVLARGGKLKVVGAVYDIETGTMNWLGSHPDEADILSGASASARGDDPLEESAARTAVIGGDAAAKHGEPVEREDAKTPAGGEAGKPEAHTGLKPALPPVKPEKKQESGHDH